MKKLVLGLSPGGEPVRLHDQHSRVALTVGSIFTIQVPGQAIIDVRATVIDGVPMIELLTDIDLAITGHSRGLAASILVPTQSENQSLLAMEFIRAIRRRTVTGAKIALDSKLHPLGDDIEQNQMAGVPDQAQESLMDHAQAATSSDDPSAQDRAMPSSAAAAHEDEPSYSNRLSPNISHDNGSAAETRDVVVQAAPVLQFRSVMDRPDWVILRGIDDIGPVAPEVSLDSETDSV